MPTRRDFRATSAAAGAVSLLPENFAAAADGNTLAADEEGWNGPRFFGLREARCGQDRSSNQVSTPGEGAA
jgi:hypothetical protein